ncbi:MAG: PhnD/SsuA/transferrin family substrate-binding protein [Pelovirga sp.]
MITGLARLFFAQRRRCLHYFSLLLVAGLLLQLPAAAIPRSSHAAPDSGSEQPAGGNVPPPAMDSQSLAWAVFAYIGIDKTRAQYQPIVDYLNQQLTDYRVDLHVLPMDAIYAGIKERQFDLVTTNPTHFLVVRQQFPLSGVLATLMFLGADGRPTSHLSGSIVVLNDRLDLMSLEDIRDKRIAAPSPDHMGGYRAQAYELHLAGVTLPDDVTSIIFTDIHQEAIRALLTKEVDVAFVRNGIIESMIANGELLSHQIRLLNQQHHDNYDMLASTRLYPEWPVFSLPHADQRGLRHITAALLSIEQDSPTARAAGIAGYNIPADYLVVEELSRALRLPPFDQPPEFNLVDIWNKWWPFLTILLACAAAIIALFTAWIFTLRREKTIRSRYAENIEDSNRQLEEEARRSARLAARAEAANIAKSEFLANMSHEIRTPMNGVIGMADLLRETSLSAEQKHYVETLHGSGTALLHLLNDILDLSKIEAGKIEFELKPIRLEQLISQLLTSFSSQIQEKGLQLTSHIDPSIEKVLYGDPARVRQVLVNLIGNAIKFTNKGGIQIHVDPLATDDVTSRLKISVTDTGIGIPADKRALLFEKFSQVDASHTRRYGGTGLGLAISRQLARLMGGDIDVSSEVGKGSTFTFALELRHQPVTGQQPPSSEPDEPATPVATTAVRNIYTDHHLNLLLVEDNPVNQQVARGLLNRLGIFSIDTADNGAAALTAVAGRRFDLILMDIQMPVMDGFEATDKIRAAEEHNGNDRTPIIALTAHAMNGDRDKCLAGGMDGYLTKPIDAQALVAEINRCLHLAGDSPVNTADTTPPAMSGEEPVFDRAQFNDRLMGDKDLSVTVITLFLEDIPRQMAGLADSIRRQDTDNAATLAHKIRGAAANVSGIYLQQTAAALEAAAQGQDVAQMQLLMPELEARFAELKTAMEAEEQ